MSSSLLWKYLFLFLFLLFCSFCVYFFSSKARTRWTPWSRTFTKPTLEAILSTGACPWMPDRNLCASPAADVGIVKHSFFHQENEGNLVFLPKYIQLLIWAGFKTFGLRALLVLVCSLACRACRASFARQARQENCTSTCSFLQQTRVEHRKFCKHKEKINEAMKLENESKNSVQKKCFGKKYFKKKISSNTPKRKFENFRKSTLSYFSNCCYNIEERSKKNNIFP